MDIFVQACGLVLIALILILTLDVKGKQIGTVVSLCACVLLAIGALRFLEPVISLLELLRSVSRVGNEMISILMKITGIGILTELSALICTDGGQGAMGKTLQFLGSCVILWLSVPIFTALIELLQEILGEV